MNILQGRPHTANAQHWMRHAWQILACAAAGLALLILMANHAAASTYIVTVGESGTIRGSYDGNNWFGLSTPVPGATLTDVAYGESSWVAVGINGAILSSTNGITWVAQANPFGTTNVQLWGVAFNGTTWLAVGYSNPGGTNATGIIASSPDGLTWTAAAAISGGIIFQDVAWNGTHWMAVAWGANGGGNVYRSTNGVNWADVSWNSQTTNLNSIHWDGSWWIASGNNELRRSTDGINWVTPATIPWSTGYAFGDIATRGSRSIMVTRDTSCCGSAGGLSTSTDNGDTWTPIIDGAFLAIANNGTHWFATGKSGLILISTDDGAIWNLPSGGSGTTKHLGAIAYQPLLDCKVQPTTVLTGATATFKALGGKPPFHWMAPGSTSP